jgi:two-component system response regulator AtoC
MSDNKILIVDDEDKMRRLLEILLRKKGHDVYQAKNGLQALNLLNQQAIDLIITDLKMPQLDGLGLIKKLYEQSSEIPVIVITAYGTIETAVEAMKYGACDYIVRPFELETVEAAVERTLRMKQVQRENQFLRQEVEKGWGEFIGMSEAIQQVYRSIKQVAPTKTSVFIQGETGTGKELVAREIHRSSPRKKSLFVALNCAAIPADILESELFGYSKGAFTGATKEHMGKFELANHGTLFLDEITEMDINLQTKLLRVLQERTLQKLGSNRTLNVDIRIIAASNKDPRQAVDDQKLREDLFYRLNVFSIELPPLRGRQGDIIPLAQYFIEKHVSEMGYSISDPVLSQSAVDYLNNYSWPGNVRELENIMERAVVLSTGAIIDTLHLPREIVGAANHVGFSPETALQLDSLMMQAHVEELEKNLIQLALRKTANNKAKAAQLLQISERSLWYKLKKYF